MKAYRISFATFVFGIGLLLFCLAVFLWLVTLPAVGALPHRVPTAKWRVVARYCCTTGQCTGMHLNQQFEYRVEP